MSFCTSCGAPAAPGAKFCGSCGRSIAPDTVAGATQGATQDVGATVAMSHAPRTASSRSHSFPSVSTISTDPSGDGAEFPPGTMLADRYRIVGLLGRGGMGEVYRADDLTLGQAVALKFLPEELQTNAGRRDRFREEVRIARQIAHPNVCRVYDIGEVDGRTFTTMEFVDGEDLVSLLRRIGRLPQEKGLEIARQLCAGLAAIHDRGVLHRDLKPANVMIDGRGRVRITDFGLSAAAEGIDGSEVRAGTPAYMAPEQLAGREVSAKSDIFALGLVLYEIFTGKRAFEARSLAELQRLHRDSTPASPSSVLSNLDPVIERVIERCLEKDPARRPSSAIAIAAALPGGDPVAAALAAGETPSPEMVAASGTSRGVKPIVAVIVFAAVLVALFFESTTLAKLRIHRVIPFEKPPAVLEERTREILARIGHDAPVGDRASGFDADDAIVAWATQGDSIGARTDALRGGRIPLASYWMRQSPRTMLPRDSGGRVSPTDPAPVLGGMSLVSVDPVGPPRRAARRSAISGGPRRLRRAHRLVSIVRGGGVGLRGVRACRSGACAAGLRRRARRVDGRRSRRSRNSAARGSGGGRRKAGVVFDLRTLGASRGGSADSRGA